MDFEEKLAKLEAFKAAFAQLMKEHSIGIKDVDNYDNEENYVGTDYHFMIDDEMWGVDTIQETIEKIAKELKA